MTASFMALLVKSAWARGLLYYGQHLTAPVVYGRELFASQSSGRYLLVCLAFPVIGALTARMQLP